MPADSTRDYLIDEIIARVVTDKALPYERTYDSGTYRFGAAVGLMVAAKMCLWNERWDDAIALISDLESIYGSYADNPAQFGEDYPLSLIPFKGRCNVFHINGYFIISCLHPYDPILRFAK